MGQVGKFGLRIRFKDGKKDFQWYIEESFRNQEYNRYNKNWAVSSVRKITRKNG